MASVLIVAPHADDETLGCGGTILKHLSDGDSVHWVIVTAMNEDSGYDPSVIARRKKEIAEVADTYKVDSLIELNFLPAQLDTYSKGDLVQAFSKVLSSVEPEIVYLPYRYDAHSDHEAVYDSAVSAAKSFRAPFIQRVLSYETISETDYDLRPGATTFKPNFFVDISEFLDRKLDILSIYSSEIGPFPFPRSLEAVESLAKVRGAQCNRKAAEAFMLIKEIV